MAAKAALLLAALLTVFYASALLVAQILSIIMPRIASVSSRPRTLLEPDEGILLDEVAFCPPWRACRLLLTTKKIALLGSSAGAGGDFGRIIEYFTSNGIVWSLDFADLISCETSSHWLAPKLRLTDVSGTSTTFYMAENRRFAEIARAMHSAWQSAVSRTGEVRSGGSSS